jgi:hypothetical protein
LNHYEFLGSAFVMGLGPPSRIVTRLHNPPRGAIAGSEKSQFWRPIKVGETASGKPKYKKSDEGSTMGRICCGICARPLPGYPEEGVPKMGSFEWLEYALDRNIQEQDGDKYIGWAWKLGHPQAKRSAGRPGEYHPECRKLQDAFRRFEDAIPRVTFSPDSVGDGLIDIWKTKLRVLTNTSDYFGSGRYSEEGRRARFARKKK